MLPITIIGGYLGAGKTTVVNHLLRNADGVRLAILVNEFGSLPIDADLIEAQDEDIISIAGGCVCCSYGNDLTLALMDLAKLDPAPDHVVLEASGVALPGAIAASVSLLQGYTLDGIIVLTDVETVMEQASDVYIGDTIERQLIDADLVVLNKTDLISDDELQGVSKWMRDKAPRAETICSRHGAVAPAILLQSFLSQDRGDLMLPAHDADVLKSQAFTIEEAVDVEKLAEGLASRDLGLLRAKGFVDPIVGVRCAIQVVGRRWSVEDASPDAPLGLVTIGRQSTFDETAILSLISESAL